MTDSSDPMRLADTERTTPLGRLMLSASRDVPSDQQLAQLAERLAGVLEPLAFPPGLTGASVIAKLGVVTGLAVLVVGGVFVSGHPQPISRSNTLPSESSPPLTLQSAPSAALRALAPVGLAAAPSSTIGAGAPSAAKKAHIDAARPSLPTAADGPSEPALLEHARRELGSAPAAALALTSQHSVRFPHGVLAQEREVIAIEALRRLGRTDEAERRSAAFAEAYPGSAHQRMVLDPAPK